MLDTLLLLTALIPAIICLTVRRYTWNCQWERGTTITVACLAAGTVLDSPHLETLSERTHFPDWGGTWPTYTAAANLISLIGVMAFAYDLANRLDWSQKRRSYYLQTRLALPAAIAFPTMGGAWAVDKNHWLVVPILAAMTFWLLAGAYWHLWTIRVDDPRANHVVDLYLAAFTFALAGTIAFVGRDLTGATTETARSVAWQFMCATTTLLAVGATISWIRKTRFMKTHLWRRALNGKLAPKAAKTDPPAIAY